MPKEKLFKNIKKPGYFFVIPEKNASRNFKYSQSMYFNIIHTVYIPKLCNFQQILRISFNLIHFILSLY